MNTKRLTIIPGIEGKLTRDGKLSEPDIYRILEKWLERHPAAKGREGEIRIGRGRRTLQGGIRTELIWVTMTHCEHFADYDPAQDADLCADYLAEDSLEEPTRSQH